MTGWVVRWISFDEDSDRQILEGIIRYWRRREKKGENKFGGSYPDDEKL